MSKGHHHKPQPSPPPPPPPSPQPGTMLAQDLAASSDVVSVWDVIAAASPSRIMWFATGGPTGGPYREATVLPGDDYYGSRAQVGNNDWRGSFIVYNEGEHAITDFDVRLPSNFPINGALGFQQIMQMKQAQPSNNGGVDSPRIELDAYNGQWRLRSDLDKTSDGFWTAPAGVGQWTHVHMDVFYSQDPAKGFVQMSIGDFSSPTMHFATLVPEIAGPSTAIKVGASIPATLMIGIYHAAAYGQASVDFTNVKVTAV